MVKRRQKFEVMHSPWTEWILTRKQKFHNDLEDPFVDPIVQAHMIVSHNRWIEAKKQRRVLQTQHLMLHNGHEANENQMMQYSEKDVSFPALISARRNSYCISQTKKKIRHLEGAMSDRSHDEMRYPRVLC